MQTWKIIEYNFYNEKIRRYYKVQVNFFLQWYLPFSLRVCSKTLSFFFHFSFILEIKVPIYNFCHFFKKNDYALILWSATELGHSFQNMYFSGYVVSQGHYLSAHRKNRDKRLFSLSFYKELFQVALVSRSMSSDMFPRDRRAQGT